MFGLGDGEPVLIEGHGENVETTPIGEYPIGVAEFIDFDLVGH
jgi:hypothetical protein